MCRLLGVIFAGVLLAPFSASALGMLSRVSDLISTSIPSSPADHTIQFTLLNDVPPGGHIDIIFDSNAFYMPDAMTLGDIALAIKNGTEYYDQPIADAPSAGVYGVSLTTGSSTVITLTSSSADDLPAGTALQFRIGTVAAHDPDSAQVINPPDEGSYHVRMNTYDASSVQIDYGSTLDAILAPVSLSAFPPIIEVGRFNGQPSGEVPAGDGMIELSLQTDKPAICRYSTTPDTPYLSMTDLFESSPDKQTFYIVLSGFVDGQSYTYYVRCSDLNGAKNKEDYPISFYLDPTPESWSSLATTTGTPGIFGTVTLGNGGVGDYLHGSNVLYRSSVRISGQTSPGAAVAFLKDGVALGSAPAGSDGAFAFVATDLERATYTFQAYVVDRQKRKSSPVSATIDVRQGTVNSISNVLVAPTIAAENDTVEPGTPAALSGESVPNSIIQVSVQRQSDLAFVELRSASTSADGLWTLSLDTAKLPRDTYIVKARANTPEAQSGWSALLFLNVGKSSTGNLNRSDLNHDGKVNLIDFSILLSHWNSDDQQSDINGDGAVNLADFSIMLFNWTG